MALNSTKQQKLKGQIKYAQEKSLNNANLIMKQRKQQSIMFFGNDLTSNHHQSASYVPISQNITLVDVLSRIFPVIKNMNSEQKCNIYDDITEENWEGDKVTHWYELKKKYLIHRDIECCIQMYLFYRYASQSNDTFNFIKQYYNLPTIEKIAQINKNLPITIDCYDQIDEYSIIKTYKEFFCIRCKVYDCQQHQIADNSKFYNPLTSEQIHDFENQKQLNNFYFYLMKKQNQKFQNEDQKVEFCSDHCYLRLTTRNIEKKLDNYQPINNFQRALIKLGIQTFSYKPCSIQLMNPKDITCELVFLYLIKDFNLPYKIEDLMAIEGEEQIIKKKKTKKCTQRRNQINEQVVNYIPCKHHFYDKNTNEEQHDCKKDCSCNLRGWCDKFCNCDPNRCSIRRQGCKCKGDCKKKSCPCFGNKFECDPDLCKDCFDCRDIKKKNQCRNNEMVLGFYERTVIANSVVCSGLGLFNVYPIKKGDLVLEYIGEIIKEEENWIRQKWQGSKFFYTFTVKEDKLVDGLFYANKSRFLNHSKQWNNCEARIVFSNGDYHLGLYAMKDLYSGMELLFDYDGDNTLQSQFSWIAQSKKQKELPLTIELDNESDMGFHIEI